MSWRDRLYRGNRIVFDKRYYQITGHKGAAILLWYLEMNSLNNSIRGYSSTLWTLRSLKHALVILSYPQIIRGLIMLHQMDLIEVDIQLHKPNKVVFNSSVFKDLYANK